MDFICEDLPNYGLVLVPPSSPEYAQLRADIQRRFDQPVESAPPIPERLRPRILETDRPTSAILLNQSAKTIAAMQLVWRFETVTGRSYRHSRGVLSPRPLLLPFGRTDDAFLKIAGFWQTIFPGSKRYLSESGMVGDNTDVRQPLPEEEWRGGIGFGSGGGGASGGEPVRRVTLVLDGVFFLDGEFVGPNREKLYEQTVAEADAHMLAAKIARDGHHSGHPAEEILAAVREATGPAPEHPGPSPAFRNPDVTPEELRRWALQQIAFQLLMMQKGFTPERAVYMIMGWGDAAFPHFRKA